LGFHEESYQYGGEVVKCLKSATAESYYGLGDKPADNNMQVSGLNCGVPINTAFGKIDRPAV
jgi:alpha-glucosidase